MGRERTRNTGKEAESPPQRLGTPSSIDVIAALIDHCVAAKDAAERNDEGFLVYMLAMTLEEAQAVLRRLNLGEPK